MEEVEVVMEGEAKDIKALAAFHAQVDREVQVYKEALLAAVKPGAPTPFKETRYYAAITLSLGLDKAVEELERNYPS